MMNDAVTLQLGNGMYGCIQIVAEHTIRVRFSRSPQFPESALFRYGLMQMPDKPFKAETLHAPDGVTVFAGQAALQLRADDGCFALTDASGHTLVETAAPPCCGRGGEFSLDIRLQEQDRLYGLGNVHSEQLERRGLKADMWGGGRFLFDTPIPYLMSKRGWAIHMNTIARHSFDIGSTATDRLHIAGEEGGLDFLLFVGGSLAKLLHRFTDISGKPALLPIWAYGLNYGCQEKETARGALDDALRFRQSGAPCDLIGLNTGWPGSDDPLADKLVWHPERFPIGADEVYRQSSFIGVLKRHGFKLSLRVDSWESLTVIGEEPHEALLPDESNEDAIQHQTQNRRTSIHLSAWYERFRQLVEDGVSAFLVVVRSRGENGGVGRKAKGAGEADIHNLYPLLVGKQAATGYGEQTGKRPMIHMNRGYSGLQRYVATTSGRYHEGIAGVTTVLNFGLSGHANTTTNMNPTTPEGIHYCMFLTWARINSQSQFRHPAYLEPPLRQLFQKYAKLRYRLIPYLYSAAHVAARTGMPVTRAMPLCFPEDAACETIATQYMLGDSLLVGGLAEQIYLPAGLWNDYWTGERHQGPAMLAYRIPDEAGGPLFVRGGSIIPLWPECEYISFNTPAALSLHLYPYDQSEYTLYEDDGESFAYKDGFIASTRMLCSVSPDSVTVRIWPRSGTYTGMPKRRRYDIAIHLEAKPAGVRVNGKDASLSPRHYRASADAAAGYWTYERSKGLLRMTAEECPDNPEPLTVVIRLGKSRSASRRKPLPALSPSAESPQLIVALETALRQAIETKQANVLNDAIESWWRNGADKTDDRSRLQLHWINGVMVLANFAHRQGWPTHELFGEQLGMTALQHMTSPEDGLQAMRQLAEKLVQYAANPGISSSHPVIRLVIATIARELDGDLSLRRMAEIAAVHPFHLSRLFRKETGATLSEYILSQRMRHAKLLLETGVAVYDAAQQTGYKDTAYFSNSFRKYWGATPKYFRPGKRHP
jgi:alpha-glucosidase (family GH31 glycosyl hydrolase)/AraC-like DNA-binding protein